MTEALRDYDEQAGAEPLDQADERRAPKTKGPDQAPAPPSTRAGMPVAEAELLGQYNLYNG